MASSIFVDPWVQLMQRKEDDGPPPMASVEEVLEWAESVWKKLGKDLVESKV